MGEFGPLAILAFIWWIFSAITEGRRKQRRRPPVVRRAPPFESLPSARLPGGDPSQQEGSRLEQILRDFEQVLDESRTVPPPRRTPGGWDSSEAADGELEERGSHDEYQPEVESLERLENFERPEREVVVLGGDQDALYRSRMAYADLRAKALTKGDHDQFDARIRQAHHVQTVQADKPTTDRTRRLRQAIIWREVLGPPVALRRGDTELF